MAINGLALSRVTVSLSVRRPRLRAELQEIRVCTNRTCRRQGSLQILLALSDLAPPAVDVRSGGCLGRCGAGPNLALLPDGVVVAHCGTVARAAEILAAQAGIGPGGARRSLDALALKKRAEGELEKGNFSEAEFLLSQAIEIKPFGGIHVMHKDRSVARLAASNYTGALQDAREALTLAPRFTEAYICEGDALLAMNEYYAAEKSYSTCLQIDPSIRRSKSFKARIAKLEEKLTATNTQ